MFMFCQFSVVEVEYNLYNNRALEKLNRTHAQWVVSCYKGHKQAPSADLSVRGNIFYENNHELKGKGGILRSCPARSSGNWEIASHLSMSNCINGNSGVPSVILVAVPLEGSFGRCSSGAILET